VEHAKAGAKRCPSLRVGSRPNMQILNSSWVNNLAYLIEVYVTYKKKFIELTIMSNALKFFV
jgi:hypothetical protein